MANKMMLKKNPTEMNKVCQICGKGPTVAYNRPHSLHKTKRVVKPNIQKVNGNLICTRCLRTQIKKTS